jgi:adenylate cyclase
MTRKDQQGAATTGLPPLRLSVGIHYGPALVAVVESEGRREFTVLGDTVNVAARIQQLCSQLPQDLVVSEEVIAACSQAFDQQDWSSLSERRLRGRAKEIALRAFAPAEKTQQQISEAACAEVR